MPEGENLPTLREAISSWLGFQLPAVSMPQTVRNFDKAVGRILLAAGENAEARIKANTGKAKAKGRIEIEGMYRTDEEKRKLENRADTVQVAVNELNAGDQAGDAHTEIDDDWLNLFARLAEDKSSEELQSLFGKILSGEIRKPGSFSLRTIQFVSTLSREDAQSISNFLSYAIGGSFVPLLTKENTGPQPDIRTRILMQELGLASHASRVGGLSSNMDVPSGQRSLLPGVSRGILIENKSVNGLKLTIGCQVLTKQAKELISVANPGPLDLGFLKAVGQLCIAEIKKEHSSALMDGLIRIFIVNITNVRGDSYSYNIAEELLSPPES